MANKIIGRNGTEFGIFSFFTGAGFLDLGFEDAGFRSYLANELDSNFASVYRYSRAQMKRPMPVFGMQEGDVCSYLNDESKVADLTCKISSARKDVKLVGFIGGPPCPRMASVMLQEVSSNRLPFNTGLTGTTWRTIPMRKTSLCHGLGLLRCAFMRRETIPKSATREYIDGGIRPLPAMETMKFIFIPTRRAECLWRKRWRYSRFPRAFRCRRTSRCLQSSRRLATAFPIWRQEESR